MHGGDIYRNDVELDFSVNTNPLGIPEEMREAMASSLSLAGNYPDIRYERLREALSEQTGIPSEQLIPGNGASELFHAAAHALKPDKVLLAAPCFTGYQNALPDSECVCSNLSSEEREFLLGRHFLDDLKSTRPGMVILGNPNNPTGRLIPPDVLKEILTWCEEHEIWLIVDESFLPFTDAGGIYEKLWEETDPQYLIRIGSYTKIYAIPGVRLGWLSSKNKEMLGRIRLHLPEWNVSCIAEACACCSFDREDFLSKTRAYIAEERASLEAGLTASGITVYPSDANYLLLQTELPLYEIMLRQKVLIRDCGDYKGLSSGYYRVAVKTAGENKRLISLAAYLTRQT